MWWWLGGIERTEVPPARLARQIRTTNITLESRTCVKIRRACKSWAFSSRGESLTSRDRGDMETVTPLYNVMSDQTWVERQPGTDYRLTLIRLVIGDEVSLACRNAIYADGLGTDICFLASRPDVRRGYSM
jgi:hypothetical protein